MLMKGVFIFFATLFLIYVGPSNAEVFKIGAVFEGKENEPSTLIDAFNLAINDINESKDYGFQFEPVIRFIGDTFTTLRSTCALLEEQVIGIFGPMLEDNSNVVQSICDAKKIPHIEMRWDDHPLYDTTVNVHPNPDGLIQSYVDIIEAWGWKDFVVLYDSDENLQIVGELLHKFSPIIHKIVVRELPREYRYILKELWKSGQTHFVLVCNIENLQQVLHKAQQVGLMSNKENYIITNPDMHTINTTDYQYGETNITGLLLVNRDHPELKRVAAKVLGVKDESKLRLQEALVYDAVMMFAEAIKEILPITNLPKISCQNYNETFSLGTKIINTIKNNGYEGLTGRAEFDPAGRRIGFNVLITELQEEGVTKVGVWNSTETKPLTIVKEHSKDFDDFVDTAQRTFIVETILLEPYCMPKESVIDLQGNDRYEGFAIDLIHELSLMTGFNYTIRVREDSQIGIYDQELGKWTGIIGDLIEKRVDLAVTDLTITEQREEVIDFSIPFMSAGIGILYQKPSKQPLSSFFFASVVSYKLWGLLLAACVVVSLILFIFGRISPSEWKNPYPCTKKTKYLVSDLSLNNCLWFVSGSIMLQGSNVKLRSVPSRIVAAVWWLFALIMISSYTANLVIIFMNGLTETCADPDFRDIYELVYKAEEKGITYGVKRGGATFSFFKEASINPLFAKAMQFMVDHQNEVLVTSNYEGVMKAEVEKFAFIAESTVIEYATERHCSLTQINGLLNEKGYGIAMRKNAPFRTSLDTALLKLQFSGKLEEFKIRWWKNKNGGGRCMDEPPTPEIAPLELKHISGLTWIIIFGTVIIFLVAVIEMLIHVLIKSSKTKTSFRSALAKEIKFYFRFGETVKPILDKKRSDEEVATDEK